MNKIKNFFTAHKAVIISIMKGVAVSLLVVMFVLALVLPVRKRSDSTITAKADIVEAGHFGVEYAGGWFGPKQISLDYPAIDDNLSLHPHYLITLNISSGSSYRVGFSFNNSSTVRPGIAIVDSIAWRLTRNPSASSAVEVTPNISTVGYVQNYVVNSSFDTTIKILVYSEVPLYSSTLTLMGDNTFAGDYFLSIIPIFDQQDVTSRFNQQRLVGYNQGYSVGYIDGEEYAYNHPMIDSIIGSVYNALSTPILGDVSLGAILGVLLSVLVVVAFFRIFGG